MKIFLLCAMIALHFFAYGQQKSAWIKSQDYTGYLAPSFILLRDSLPTIDLTGYVIEGFNCQPGKLALATCNVSPEQALTAALMLIGGNYEIEKYGISKELPNLIPYTYGVIVYGYNRENDHWEVLNLCCIDELDERYPYRRFDVKQK